MIFFFCRSVADELKQGHQISPETFSQVTIYFSDIVGFTSLASDSTPIQIINMLNRLYSTFDDITDKYDVYKVRESCTTDFNIRECDHVNPLTLKELTIFFFISGGDNR